VTPQPTASTTICATCPAAPAGLRTRSRSSTSPNASSATWPHRPSGRELFVLKGGLLLAQFGARRITRDIDILGLSFPGDETEIVRRIAAIATT
jgi:hypothetical protein